MKTLLLSILFGQSVLACPEHKKSFIPKFSALQCVENTPENEFTTPDMLKILVVGKQRYQFRRWDVEENHWSDTKENDLINSVDSTYHVVQCKN